MANDKAAASPEDSRFAQIETRLTTLEAGLAKAIQDFTPVGTRVAELSSAFQTANTRLASLESRMVALEQAPPPVGAEALQALAERLDQLTSRLIVVEQIRARGGRLSSRLAGIEAALKRIEDGGETT